MGNRILAGLKGWKKYLLLYGALLVLSHLVMWMTDFSVQQEFKANGEVEVQVVTENHTHSGQQVTIRYRDIYNGRDSNPQTILLLPGGPEGPEVFEQLQTELSSQYRLIIPYLPGYGNRDDSLPDYSFKSLSVYTNQFLDKLGLSNIHILGYGLGGASAIYLANDYPQKVQSLTLASSIGVQELELLGSYRLNHAVHGVQLGAVWLMHNAIPHFGLLDALDIDVSYAKSHYESDQRPLRSHLRDYQKPMLILHGADDPLVPLAAAKEHYRIVPQSKLKIYDADHDLLQTHSDSVGQAITAFLQDQDKGRSRTAATASQSRIQEAQKPFSNIDFSKFEGIPLLIIMVIIMFSTLISEDLTCIGAGLLAARGLIGFWPATIACLLGIYIGDIALYLAGRFLGRPAVKKIPFKWFISEKDLKKSARWFAAKGPAIIIATRFLPGSRLPTYFSAGVIRANFWMFSFYFLLAAIVWTPMLVGISKLLGNELLNYFSVYSDYALWVFLGAILFLVMFIKVVIPVFSYKGRRLLVSRYRRFTRWEYWSPFILYTPVTCYIIYLGIKYRCMTLFTAVNPAIPDSGFVGESKTAILDLFEDQDSIAKYKRLSSDLSHEQLIKRAEAFKELHNLSYPVVLKPDVGQRGVGVRVIHTKQQMENYFSDIDNDLIIQEYVDGKEYGVFYYSKPGKEQGDVFSITTKHLLSVEGDGQRTIQELILADDEAVSLAKYHLKQNQDRLYQVPDPGQQVPIVELGTHARGAVFGDGQELITEELAHKMHELCQQIDGFCFGRFDLKAPSKEDLKRGEALKIIEANGVTSESTNIYDSKFSFFDAQKILFQQWRLAFEIGHLNRKRDVEPAALFPFLKRVFQAITK